MLSTNHVKLAEFVELPQPVRAKRNAAASTAAVKRNHRFKKNNLIPFIFAQKRKKRSATTSVAESSAKNNCLFVNLPGFLKQSVRFSVANCAQMDYNGTAKRFPRSLCGAVL